MPCEKPTAYLLSILCTQLRRLSSVQQQNKSVNASHSCTIHVLETATARPSTCSVFKVSLLSLNAVWICPEHPIHLMIVPLKEMKTKQHTALRGAWSGRDVGLDSGCTGPAIGNMASTEAY